MNITVFPGPMQTLDQLFDEYEREIAAKREAMTPAERKREQDEEAAHSKRRREEMRRMRKARAVEKANRDKSEEL